MLVVALAGWLVAAVLGVIVWQLDRARIAPPSPPGITGDSAPTAYRVVQTTPDGRRARMMLERGEPGKGEVLELYDGPHLRGRKQGAGLTT